MGWNTVTWLEVDRSVMCIDGCVLVHHRGLNGVEIHIGENEIRIPKQVILDLVAQEYIDKQINKYKSINTIETLKEMGL